MALFPGMKKRKAQEPFAETTFECRRGDLTIRGTEYRPEGDNLPVAIVSHGFMAWQDTVRHYAKELARMGYCAYCFDVFSSGNGCKAESRKLTTICCGFCSVEATAYGGFYFLKWFYLRRT